MFIAENAFIRLRDEVGNLNTKVFGWNPYSHAVVFPDDYLARRVCVLEEKLRQLEKYLGVERIPIAPPEGYEFISIATKPKTTEGDK